MNEIDYLHSLMDEREKMMNQRFKDVEEAVNKAQTALERRLDLLNEFRSQSVEEQKRFVNYDVYILGHKSLEQDIKRIESRDNKLIGALILVTMVLPLTVAGITHLLST